MVHFVTVRISTLRKKPRNFATVVDAESMGEKTQKILDVGGGKISEEL